MKKAIKLIVLLLLAVNTAAQHKATLVSELPCLFLRPGVSLHLVSPEPIRYVDISTGDIVGDLPEEHILRLKFDSSATVSQDKQRQGLGTVVTVVGQNYLAQYVVYLPSGKDDLSVARREISPEDMQPLELSEFSLSRSQLKEFALRVASRKPSHRKVKSRHLGMSARLNNIYAVGDYVFVDLSFHNQTRISYEIDMVRFHLKDKRIARATNVQSLELKPEFVLYRNSRFQRSYRNVYVFRKLTFPGNKQFCVELAEKQISGRTIELAIDYRDLLGADTF